MRCINCGIAMKWAQRHVVSSLPMDLQKTLAQWLSINELPEDGHICQQCFIFLSSGTPSERLLGHSMVCRGCGRSVRDIRHCIVESDSPLLQEFTFTLRLPETISNYLCYPCWCRTKRHLRTRQGSVQSSDHTYHEDAKPLDSLNCTETCHNVYDSHFVVIKHEVHSDTEVPEVTHESDCHEDTEVPEVKHECHCHEDTEVSEVKHKCNCHEDTEVPEVKHGCDCQEDTEVPEVKHGCDCHEDPPDVDTDFSFEDVSPRQKSQERHSQPPNLPPSPVAQATPTTDKITLPNYTRAPNTSSYCIFSGYCNNRSRLLIPKFIKRILLKDHNFYIPPNARVCELHLNTNEWNNLPKNSSKFSTFTPRQIEDMIKLSKSTGEYMNFEDVDEMPNHVCQYWTGRTVSEFLDYLNTLPLLNVPKRRTALAIYLAKLKTGETNRRLATIFNIPRATLESMMKKVRTCLENLTRESCI